MASDFGWNLPPGVTPWDIERAQGFDTCECPDAGECLDCFQWHCLECGIECACETERPEDWERDR